MEVFVVDGVNDALYRLALSLKHEPSRWVQRKSRAGEVLEFVTPVSTRYEFPTERVLVDSVRDANPFFHLVESLWILAGREDVAPLAVYLRRIADYSDNGVTFHGAYGARLRRSPIGDQLRAVAEELRRDRTSRRAVAAVWNAERDLGTVSLDIPCNTLLAFKVRADDRLHLTVFNRSNDAVWGAYGANAVQFSILLEYVAALVGVPVGTYTQVSDSFHVYSDNAFVQAIRNGYTPSQLSPYWFGLESPLYPYPLLANGEEVSALDEDIHAFFTGGRCERTAYFRAVVTPMREAFLTWRRTGNREAALEALSPFGNTRLDWLSAAREWIDRRADAREAADAGRGYVDQDR